MTDDGTARAAAAMDRVGMAIGIHAEHLAGAVDPRVEPRAAVAALGGVLLLAFFRGFGRAAAGAPAEARPEARGWLERRLTEVVEGSGPAPSQVAAATDATVAVTRRLDAGDRSRLAAERRAAVLADLSDFGMPPVRARRILDAVADNALALVAARCAEVARSNG